MKPLLILLGVLQLLAAAAAVYKQWIPNTNFETPSNWDKGRVPCARDVVHFDQNKVLSVFVGSPHVLSDMYLPLNGELVLASGAGFAAFDGSWDPGCDSGAPLSFGRVEQPAWFDPALWQPVSPAELQPSGRLFSVDEERVPCRHDSVIFQPQTSFWVSTDSSRPLIPVRSVSVMGQELSSPEAWAEYLRGPSAALQFHGNATLQVTGSGCPDKSGCACGNGLDSHRICAALLGAPGSQCPAPACRSPLRPLGHCCGICGAIVKLDFTPDFDLQKYRDRLVQALLSQPKYSGVQMAISKVLQEQTLLGVVPRGSAPLIQVVLMDDGAGAQAGRAAEQLAKDIMEDIAQAGEALGISSGSMEAATGSTSSGQVGSHTASRVAAGTVCGILLGLLFLGGVLFCYRKRNLRLSLLYLPQPWHRMKEPVFPEPDGEKGFDNPVFHVELPSTREEIQQEMAPKDHQVFYLNPLYDASETET
ncbi:protein amnionless [Colius striatus]|uniref:protein amnionless n=1 Tax=Colius striatus TaxID=57412 RepID=UPI002B1E280A|nr:protein amnionless [Colius striatus]